jgi:hypothetical protein
LISIVEGQLGLITTIIFLVAKQLKRHGATKFRHGGHGATSQLDLNRVGRLKVEQ